MRPQAETLRLSNSQVEFLSQTCLRTGIMPVSILLVQFNVLHGLTCSAVTFVQSQTEHFRSVLLYCGCKEGRKGIIKTMRSTTIKLN